MKKIILCFTLWSVLFSSMIFAAPQKKTVRFATEATYPPFEYVDETGKIKGFDIDIANALCQQMQVQCTFAIQSFNSLIPSLNLGKFDAIIASIGITPARRKQINFTQSYYQPSASFVALKSKHYTLQDMIGKTIGVQEGTTFAQYLKDEYAGKVNVKFYASIQDAFLDLVSGRVDAVLADLPIATDWLKQNDNQKNYELVGKPLVNDQYFGSGYGIGVQKNNTELLNSLNKALVEIKANGTYDKIVNKYFGAK